MAIDGVIPRSIGRGMAPSAVGAHTVSALLSFGLHVAIVAFVVQATFQPATIASLPAINVTLLSEDLPGSPSAASSAGPRTRPHPSAQRAQDDGGAADTPTTTAEPDVTPPPKAVREAKAVRTTLHDEAALEPPPPPPPPKPARPAATPVPVVPSSVATEPEVAVAPMPADPVQSAAASAPVAPPKAVKAPETKVAIAPRPAAFVDVSDTPPAPREPASGGLARLSPDYDKGVPSPAGDREAAGAALAGNPPPEYPYLARRRGIEGSVVVGVTVLSDGYPQRVWVIASSGHGILDRAAATAVRKWKFIAARRRGAPVAASIEVPITFRLED